MYLESFWGSQPRTDQILSPRCQRWPNSVLNARDKARFPEAPVRAGSVLPTPLGKLCSLRCELAGPGAVMMGTALEADRPVSDLRGRCSGGLEMVQ